MFWKFKRWRAFNKRIHGIRYFYIGTILLLFMNIFTITRHVISPDNGNKYDPGGHRWRHGASELKHNVFQERNLKFMSSARNEFKNKLQIVLSELERNLEKATGDGISKQTDLFQTFFPDRVLNCDNVFYFSDNNYIASGWTKAVYKGMYNGYPVAVKIVDPNGQDVRTCVDSGLTYLACYIKATKKIVKEMIVLDAIAGKNVLKVLGICLQRISDDNLRVAMVTELGESVDLIKLLQMSWEDRLKICLDITRIINEMSKTPYGSMSMNDFRRQQFVLVDGTLKLSDVDDTGFDDPGCEQVRACRVTFSSSNFTQRTRCQGGRCVQFNEKKNVFNAGRHFVTFLLPHGAPHRLQPIIAQVVNGYSNLTLTSEQLLGLMNKIVALYQSGWYRHRSNMDQDVPKYKRIGDSDLPGRYDYRCRLSLSMGACTVSVFDVQEAEDICNTDSDCKGFVLSDKRTWTGRHLIYLKNAVDKPAYNPETILYIKEKER